MKRVSVAMCSVVVLSCTTGRLSAEDWRFDLGGSWSLTRLDDEFGDFGATTAVGFSTAASVSHGRAFSRVQYDLSWYSPPDDDHDLQVDRGDAILLLGCRILADPQILPYLGFRYISTGASPGQRTVGDFSFTHDSRYQGLGMGFRIEKAFRGGEITGLADGFLLPWGKWESDRHNCSIASGEPHEWTEHWEDDSPRCFGGSLGASYRLPQSKASIVADLRFVVTLHESDAPDSGVIQRFQQTWKGFTLGLRFPV